MMLGIDLGGTKISGIVLDQAGVTLAYQRVATPAGDYQATLQSIADLVAALERDAGKACSIGVGTPGAISPATGKLRNSNSVCLNAMPLKADLEQLLGRPIFMANDADCFTLSEATNGAAADADSVFGVILGTGTGGGLVINGRLVVGKNAIAGEWGHNPLPWMTACEYPGESCYCGKQGCIETFLSGPAMQRHYTMTYGGELDARAIASQDEHDENAAVFMTLYVDRLARALANVINIVDPEIIVLGGGLSNIDLLYDQVPLVWGKYVFSDVVATRLVKHVHGDDSGVRGAAQLSMN